MTNSNARIAVLGAGRGLGLAIAHQVLQLPVATSLFLMSKHAEQARAPLASKSEVAVTIAELDFTHADSAKIAFNKLVEFQPSHIWYVAGGGPYGAFGDKQWKDHLWAFQLNLLFPLELFHQSLSGAKDCSLPSLPWHQWVFVGSAIAESRPEINGLAYGSGKCALKSAWENWQAECAHDPSRISSDVRLYSPGYIDTGMLPPQAWPRQAGLNVQDVGIVASDFLNWSFDISHKNEHRTFGV